MRFTEELRAWAREHQVLVGGLGLEEIADRIDEGLANYVELPKDADGETIHLGDVMGNMHKDGFRAKRVTGICYHEGGQTTIKVDEVRLRWYDAYELHHAQPDSWESIISEFAERVLRSGHQWGLDAPAATAEFVERCKRLAGEE